MFISSAVLTFGTGFWPEYAVDAPEYIIRVPENLKHVGRF